MFKNRSILLSIVCLLFITLAAGTGVQAVAIPGFDPPSIGSLPGVTPEDVSDITDVVKLLHAHPELTREDAAELLTWISPVTPEPERIIAASVPPANTVTGDVYSTYTLPAAVTVFTNTGRTYEEPVTWRDYGYNEVTSVSTAEAGTYTFYTYIDGYAPTIEFVLTVTDSDMYRIILTWNANPWDIDSHLFGQLADEGDPFHIYYANTTHAYNQQIVAELERDITTGYGPETTSIYMSQDVRHYRFGVHHYSGYGTLAQSGAVVQLYRGAELLGSFNVAQAEYAGTASSDDALYWNVFEIIEGQLHIVMTLDDDWTVSDAWPG